MKQYYTDAENEKWSKKSERERKGDKKKTGKIEWEIFCAH